MILLCIEDSKYQIALPEQSRLNEFKTKLHEYKASYIIQPFEDKNCIFNKEFSRYEHCFVYIEFIVHIK